MFINTVGRRSGVILQQRNTIQRFQKRNFASSSGDPSTKNAIAGLALFGFVAGIYAYTVRSVKFNEDLGSDFDEPALAKK